jgi:hypothetical protein
MDVNRVVGAARYNLRIWCAACPYNAYRDKLPARLPVLSTPNVAHLGDTAAIFQIRLVGD